MRIDFGQQMRMEQGMRLSPRMIQSMEILQLSAMALDERIEQELAENPLLEMTEAEEGRESLAEGARQRQEEEIGRASCRERV